MEKLNEILSNFAYDKPKYVELFVTFREIYSLLFFVNNLIRNIYKAFPLLSTVHTNYYGCSFVYLVSR